MHTILATFKKQRNDPRGQIVIELFHFTTEVDPMNIIFIFLIADLQENIYKKVRKTDYPSAGFAGR